MAAIEFLPIKAKDQELVFEKYRTALIEVIQETFGWNEDFQRERLKTRY